MPFFRCDGVVARRQAPHRSDTRTRQAAARVSGRRVRGATVPARHGPQGARPPDERTLFPLASVTSCSAGRMPGGASSGERSRRRSGQVGMGTAPGAVEQLEGGLGLLGGWLGQRNGPVRLDRGRGADRAGGEDVGHGEGGGGEPGPPPGGALGALAGRGCRGPRTRARPPSGRLGRGPAARPSAGVVLRGAGGDRRRQSCGTPAGAIHRVDGPFLGTVRPAQRAPVGSGWAWTLGARHRGTA